MADSFEGHLSDLKMWDIIKKHIRNYSNDEEIFITSIENFKSQTLEELYEIFYVFVAVL